MEHPSLAEEITQAAVIAIIVFSTVLGVERLPGIRGRSRSVRAAAAALIVFAAVAALRLIWPALAQ